MHTGYISALFKKIFTSVKIWLMNYSTRYKAVILDHDDTAVNSTSTVHYPAHVAFMQKIKPDYTPVSLDEWFMKNFNPGAFEFLKELGLTPSELEYEHRFWEKYCNTRVPVFYPGIPGILKKFREAGGLITVVSLSKERIIERDYKSINFIPDKILGWSSESDKMKPSTWPVKQILKEFNLKQEEVVLIDDLKPGITMAQNAGIKSLWAGWSHGLSEVRDYMKQMAVRELKKPSELHNILLSERR